MYTHSYIPPNINDNGNVLNGLINPRKMIEAAVCDAAIYLLVSLMTFIPPLPGMILIIILMIPATILCIVGIDGHPLSIGLLLRLSYRSSRCEVSLRMPMPIEATQDAGPKLKFRKK